MYHLIFHKIYNGVMTYIDQTKYKEFLNHKGKWLREHKVVNFDIIDHECRGDSHQNSIKTYKTFTSKNFDKSQNPKL